VDEGGNPHSHWFIGIPQLGLRRSGVGSPDLWPLSAVSSAYRNLHNREQASLTHAGSMPEVKAIAGPVTLFRFFDNTFQFCSDIPPSGNPLAVAANGSAMFEALTAGRPRRVLAFSGR
jgi:hypothetical protein